MQDKINKIPESWAEVSLYQGKQIFTLRTGLTETQYLASVYEILTGEDYSKVEIQQIESINSSIYSLLSKEIPKKELKLEYLNGKYYLEYDLSRIPWGLFVDLEMLVEQSGGNIYKNIEQILACIIREREEEKKTFIDRFKIKKKVEVIFYELKEYDSIERRKRAEELLKGLNMEEVNTIMLFFYHIGIQYIKTTLDYSLQKQKILKQQS